MVYLVKLKMLEQKIIKMFEIKLPQVKIEFVESVLRTVSLAFSVASFSL